MDCFTDPTVERVTFMSSAQIAKTTIIENVIGYFMHYDPCSMMVVQPRLQDAEDFSKDRLSTMIRDTEVLSALFGKEKTRDSNNTLLHKKIPAGYITLAGANSPAGLAGRSIRILLLDEIDRMGITSEGNPITLATKRTNNFYNRKIGAFSTPTVKGKSNIEDLYEESDKRRRFVKCPHCSKLIWLNFKQLRWENNDPTTTVYLCQECDVIIDENLKPKLDLEGVWIPEKPFKGHAGFRLNELYSPWRKWSQIVADFLEVKTDPAKLRAWVNTSLGETWQESGEAPEWRRLYDRRENYKIGTVPMRGLFLTGSADVQKDRIEAETKAWGRGRENFSVEVKVFYGDTSADPVWEELRKYINESFEHESGARLGFRLFGVDSGYNTQRVYEFVRQFPSSRVVALKGAGNQQQMIAPPKAVEVTTGGRSIKRGVRVWHVGTDLIKQELYGLLKVPYPTEEELLATDGRFPTGFLHFPEYGEEYFKQLTAESLVTKIVKGYQRHEWVKTAERNEALDLNVYNRALAAIVGIDRFKEHHWLDLESIIPKNEKPQAEKIETSSQTSNSTVTGRTQLKRSSRRWL